MQISKIYLIVITAFCGIFAQNISLFSQIPSSSDTEHKLYTSELADRMNNVSIRYSVIQVNQNVFQNQIVQAIIPIFDNFQISTTLIKKNNIDMNNDNWILPEANLYYYVNFVVKNNLLVTGMICFKGETYTIEPYLNGVYLFWQNKKTFIR